MPKRKKTDIRPLSASQKLKKSAILVDAKYIEYICKKNGHLYKFSTGEILKKPPKCPYCKQNTKMIDWDKINNKKENKEAVKNGETDLHGTDA